MSGEWYYACWAIMRLRSPPRLSYVPLSAAHPLCALLLSADLEWKLIYVGSAESEDFDQVLDSVLVGPVYPGQYRFVFQV